MPIGEHSLDGETSQDQRMKFKNFQPKLNMSPCTSNILCTQHVPILHTACAAANTGVNDRLFQRHGRWKTASAKNEYVDDNLESRLIVSKMLGI